ncbi:TRAP transporter substrate-binding protein DctP [Magnetospirillum sp. UT-4]|uniref:TRAP transporter substrate-binding protein DctP n=1 Tax=Magnetospirillum sp. UT-4 TaxID=2681467 RepID=UPI00137E6830|nr:TRAP transporter substrate-binding protein DctP [Magnetospirillum sp. UT-4]CAA7621233.1 TRAP-type C4-dicarboxylate transporter [Magnetospirillum sp. UT-4]
MLRRVFLAAGLALAWTCPGQAEPLLLRISTENSPDHVQTRAVARFADALAQRAAGRLSVSHHSGAALFRDADVVKALRQGRIEMAVPGTWHLDRLEPSVGLYLLPAFHGRDAAIQTRLQDGPLGDEINARLQATLGVTVLGRWIDLGFAHLYGVRRVIRDAEDVRGMRIRVAGGEANLRRLAAMGAEPRIVPWPDLPQAMAAGTIDGILTTHETVASGRLWEKGIGSAYEDHQYFPRYVPLVSGQFWRRLPDDLKAVMAEVWEAGVDSARADAARAQDAARAALLANGIVVTRPEPPRLAAQRQALMADQPAIVAALGIEPGLVAEAMAALAGESRP